MVDMTAIGVLLCCVGGGVVVGFVLFLAMGLCAAAGRDDDLRERRDGIRRS